MNTNVNYNSPIQFSVKAFIANGWDKRLVDPDPDKKYTLALQISKVSPDDSNVPSAQLQSHSSADSDLDSWPRGPYSQQIQGILPPIATY